SRGRWCTTTSRALPRTLSRSGVQRCGARGRTMSGAKTLMRSRLRFRCRDWGCSPAGARPGFNPLFRGFGGEEGYLHQKFRKLGRRCWCLPWLRWAHRFGHHTGVPYRLEMTDRIVNYLIGHRELGLNEQAVIDHFAPEHGVALAKALVEVDRILPR